ncbi:ATP phosphoribosyltransferase regulatory subunit [Chloroflexales bacterium ZM16-3]|nr:ATP phosphoribosyltransferase regulatory subunit [Chloroflexales bacterium ZM16-3]
MRDVLPDEQRATAYAQAALERTLAQHGYRLIDLPIIEQRELYLRKLGEELVGKVYEFSFGGRDLALRPEWTASVLRAYVANMQDQPLPLRLAYSGPVFRYERPQRGTYRQFSQVGVELVGGLTPRADAEAIALACAGLDAAGVAEYRVVVGHIGLIRELLAGLGLEERTQGILIWSMERMRADGVDAVRDLVGETVAAPPAGLALPAGLDDEQAAAWLLGMLDAMQIDLSTGTRSPQEVVARLLRKLRRGDPQPQIDRALDLLARLGQLRGAPTTILPQVADLIERSGLQSAAYAELRAILALLADHGIDQGRVEIDLGLGRGLHYYTGLIFEIYDGEQMQLCGGGRYDDLVAALGGRQPTPAVGFAYGLERVAAAAPAPPPPEERVALVAPVSDDDYAYALEVARRLRLSGFTATVDVRGRSLATNLRDAARRGVSFLAVVGAEERAQSSLVWRDLSSRVERRVALDEIADW